MIMWMSHRVPTEYIAGVTQLSPTQTLWVPRDIYTWPGGDRMPATCVGDDGHSYIVVAADGRQLSLPMRESDKTKKSSIAAVSNAPRAKEFVDVGTRKLDFD